MTATTKTLILSITLIGLLPCMTCLTGCAKGEYSPGQYEEQVQGAMTILERARFSGHVAFSAGGSPLQFVMKQVYGFGPENSAFSFTGNVDFSDGISTESD